MAQPLRMVPGSRGIPNRVVVRQTELDDLLTEITALEHEARELAELALPLAKQLAIVARAFGPQAGDVGEELVRLLERQIRRHDHTGRAA